MRKVDKSLLDYFQVTIGSGLGRGVALLNYILIARSLGPDKFGIFSFFITVMMLTWLSLGAFDTVYIRRAKDSCDYESKGHLCCNLVVKTGLGLIFLVWMSVMDESVFIFFFEKDYAYCMIVSGLGTGLFLSFQSSKATIYRIKEKFLLFTIFSNIHTFLIFAALATIWLLNKTLDLNTTIHTFIISSSVLGATFLIMILIKDKPRIPERSMFWSFISWGKWVLLISFVFALFEKVDFLFVVRYLDPSDIGIYAAGVQLVSILSVATGALSHVFLPKAVVALRSKSTLRIYIRQSVVPVVLLICIILILILIAPMLIEKLYGQEYEKSVPVARIILLGWIGASIYLPFSFIFYALDQPNISFYLELSKLLVATMFLAILVPGYGSVGAACSVASAQLLNATFSGLVIWVKLRRIMSQPGF